MLRHGYPLDRSDFVSNTILPSQFIEDVEYSFSPTTRKSPSLINYQEVYNFNQLELYQTQAIDSIVQTAYEMKPAIIHSASNFVVGMAGAKAAKALGIPSI